jgi:hypothetical protein
MVDVLIAYFYFYMPLLQWQMINPCKEVSLGAVFMAPSMKSICAYDKMVQEKFAYKNNIRNFSVNYWIYIITYCGWMILIGEFRGMDEENKFCHNICLES